MRSLPYTEIETKSVDDFFEEINPLNRGNTLELSRIYRGQENSEWPLTASIFRIYEINENKLEIDDIIRFEIVSLFFFARSLGGINLFDHRCQNITNWLEEKFSNKDITLLNEWPTKQSLELMALAQHSGLPTRLLDWTYNPYIAAHFAAHSSILNKERSEKLAVWCCDKNYTIDAREVTQDADYVNNVYRLEPPFWGSNPNAVAQSGCFLFLNKLNKKGSYSIENQLFVDNNTPDSHFLKITVPSSECEKILKYCKAFGINRSNLFRTYEGCAEEVKEKFDSIILGLKEN